jgi:glycosyltransferase involved in cell wall biosynthesis
VIEALACGLPVIAFDTGALPELLLGDSGLVTPYGGDPWKLEPPDVPALAQAALAVLADQPRFRSAARLRAEAAFGLDRMVEKYLDVLLQGQG